MCGTEFCNSYEVFVIASRSKNMLEALGIIMKDDCESRPRRRTAKKDVRLFPENVCDRISQDLGHTQVSDQVPPELSRIDWEKMTIIAPSVVSTSDDIDVENI